MKVIYHPQSVPHNNVPQITVNGENERITVAIGETLDFFDFSGFPDGKMTSVSTSLPTNPIISAERKDGELTVHVNRQYGPSSLPAHSQLQEVTY